MKFGISYGLKFFILTCKRNCPQGYAGNAQKKGRRNPTVLRYRRKNKKGKGENTGNAAQRRLV
jgi:hypothetical protein